MQTNRIESPNKFETFCLYRPLATSRDELHFVLQSWLRSLRQLSRYYREISKDIYFREQQRIVKNIISRGNVLVVSPKADDNIIIGYIVHQIKNANAIIVHYVYVKNEYRGNGIATSLLNRVADGKQNIIATFKTGDFGNENRITYDPYAIS